MAVESNMKRLILTLFLVCLVRLAGAQDNNFFTHYSTEDGLSQNTVMGILQDRRGAMWFSTWDGLNMFNGYTFKTYKGGQDSRISFANNRMELIGEDMYGFLWLLTYDDRVHRFNITTEESEQVPSKGEGSQMNITSIKLLDNGTVWLLTDKMEAIRVRTNSNDLSLTWDVFSGQSDFFSMKHFINAYLDSLGNEWILTDNGLGLIKNGQDTVIPYFSDIQKESPNSNQAFYSFFENDREIFFGSGGGRVWRFLKVEERFELLELPTLSSIVSINSIATGKLLVATRSDGFFTCDVLTGDYKHYSHSDYKELSHKPILSVYVDSHGEVWFEQEETSSVVHFNPVKKQLKRETMKTEPATADRSHPKFHIHEDIHGRLWVHPFGGGMSYFDREKNKLVPFHNEPGSKDWKFSNKLHSAFSDRQGNLWMGTHSKGLEKVTFKPRQFHLITPYPEEKESLSNEVRSIMEDDEKNIWVGFKNSTVRVYDSQMNYRGYLTADGTISKNGIPLEGVAYNLMQDSQGIIWISTKGNGLVRAEKDFQRPGAYRITRYQHNPDELYSLSNDNVYCTYEDSNGRIWVATFAGGLNYIDKEKNGKFINHRNHLKQYPIDNCYKVRFVTSDNKGNIWVGTTTGAICFDGNFINPEDIVFYHYSSIPGDLNSLSNNDIHWIINTRQDELYFAASGGGLNKLISMDEAGNARFKSYMKKDGQLPSDVVLSIREDAQENLWISTEHAISKFIPSKEFFENYGLQSFMFNVRFSEAASTITSSGRAFFGASNGIFHFHPDSIRKSTYVPPILFSQTFDEKEGLVLNHDENNLSIGFVALDYTTSNEIQYAYMLDGFDKNWNYKGKERDITYANLPKGTYTFQVKSTNGDGAWVDNIHSMPLEILPSFWETPWAYILYFLIIGIVIWIAVYILFTIYRLKHEVSIEQEISDIKLRFFTNISHELRTPLTLISGPVETILQKPNLPGDVREQLQVVERNTSRMLRLVNQILDFRKIQNKKMKLRVQKLDIVPFIRKVMDNFESLAEDHHIDYILEAEKDDLYLWVDEDKFEKILFNLLSNAFKYTPHGKMIAVFVREDNTTISVEVRDQGIGIAENKKQSIFMRFENLMDRNLFNHSASSGIGLSLVKELVDMHKATISVDSKLGEGSGFKVEFLKGKDHYDEGTEFILADQIVTTFEKVETKGDTSVITEVLLENTAEVASSQRVLLIVEDNSELRTFLRRIFADKFRVIEAADGMEGWSKALKFLPDIIISDVMMPEKDGIEMMKELRADMTTSHIPIVLLTAKTSIENKLEGLEYGADDYITKPFSTTYLQARVKNILAQREKLQAMYRSNLMNEAIPSSVKEEMEKPAEQLEMTSIDRKFMDKLMELMEKNIDNGELMVDDLVTEMAVSRSVFFKKLKTLTGLAPIEFIKEVRIKRATQLIESGEFNMTQISYMVGINDPRYFSKCFKQKTGMTPTEYRDKIFKK